VFDYRRTLVIYRVRGNFFRWYWSSLVLDISVCIFQTVAVAVSKTEITRSWHRNECQLYVTYMYERCRFFVTFAMSQMTFFRHSKLTFWQSLKHTSSSRIQPTRIPLLWTILIYEDSHSIVLQSHEIVMLMKYFLSNLKKSNGSKCQLQYLVSNKIRIICGINIKILSIFYVCICLSVCKKREGLKSQLAR
jgi:hypothetical protein